MISTEEAQALDEDARFSLAWLRHQQLSRPLVDSEQQKLHQLETLIKAKRPVSSPPVNEAPMAKKTTKTGYRPTRHRASTKKELTSLQRKGLAALDGDQQARLTARSRKKSLAARTARKIGRRHKIIRGEVYLAVAVAVGIGKTLKVAGKGAGKAGRWGGQKVATKIKKDVHRRKWVPAADRPAGTRWFQPVQAMKCCGQTFTTVQGINSHMVNHHRGEARKKINNRPQIQRGHTRRTAGKVIVRPAGHGGGRHRARHNLPDAKRVIDLVTAYQTQIANAKKRVEKIMNSDASATQAILRNAGAALGEIQIDSRTKLSEFRELLVGLEMGMGFIADGVQELGLTLRSERGGNIDPALVRPHMDRIVEHISEAGREFTRFVVAFEDVYHLHIKAENGELAKPNINLAG